MLTDQYFCDKCGDGKPLLDKVYIVPKRVYHYDKDQHTGANIVVAVDILEEKMTLCEKHYQEDLNAEQIKVHRNRS